MEPDSISPITKWLALQNHQVFRHKLGNQQYIASPLREAQRWESNERNGWKQVFPTKSKQNFSGSHWSTAPTGLWILLKVLSPHSAARHEHLEVKEHWQPLGDVLSGTSGQCYVNGFYLFNLLSDLCAPWTKGRTECLLQGTLQPKLQTSPCCCSKRVTFWANFP